MNPLERRPSALRYRRLSASLLLFAVLGCSDGDDDPALFDTAAQPDTTAPTVTVDAAAVPLNRTATLTATAGDDVGVARVEFQVDGAPIGTDSSAPYSTSWDTRAVADGTYVITAVASDAAGNSTTSAPVSVTVQNQVRFELTLGGAQENPPNASAASGTGTIDVDLGSGAASGTLTLSGLTAGAAHIHDGFAGVNGPVVIGFEQDGANPALWRLPAGATLTDSQLDRLLAGALYVNAHSDQFPEGEVRAQIVPPGVTVVITDMEGFQEVPAVTSEARARAAATLDEVSGAIRIHLNAQGLDDATAAHLHRGIAGTNGPVVVSLMQDGSVPGHWFVETATLEPADVEAFRGGRTYVNIHTPDHMDGELRGQVAPPGTLVLVNRMSGEQEVPVRTTDAAGTAALTVDTATGVTEVHLNASGVDDAVAAHVHDGFAGVNGPAIITLAKDADPANPGHWLAAGATMTAEQVAKLRAGGLYANVHTPAAPEGLIRGQLLPPEVRLTLTDLSGSEEVPPVTTTASARAATTVNTSTPSVTIHVNTSQLDTANAAHIHRGAAGSVGAVAVGLTQDAGTPSRWSATAVTITAEQLQDYLTNQWYVNVHTPQHPDGEIRGQIIATPESDTGEPPPAGDTEAPTVTLGAVAATLSGTVTLSATATDNVGVTEVRFKVNGTVVGSDSAAPYAFEWDSTSVANGTVTLSAEAVDAAGNAGSSAEVTSAVSNAGAGVARFTFPEIQAQVFNVSCAVSGCHSGPNPQAGMDLSAGASYQAIVNVASSEVPSLMRVAPNDASGSYLIRKLEGGPDIRGARMPLGGPYLPQATIDRIRAWIDAGAPPDGAPSVPY